jgi:hypothetical protein
MKSILHKTHVTSHYAKLNLTCMDDPRTTWDAKGIHTYVMSRPDGWDLWRNDLLKRSPDGEGTLRSALKNLKDTGYLSIDKVKNEKCKIIGWIYNWYDEPQNQEQETSQPDVSFPHVENPQCGETTCGKTTEWKNHRVEKQGVYNKPSSSINHVLEETNISTPSPADSNPAHKEERPKLGDGVEAQHLAKHFKAELSKFLKQEIHYWVDEIPSVALFQKLLPGNGFALIRDVITFNFTKEHPQDNVRFFIGGFYKIKTEMESAKPKESLDDLMKMSDQQVWMHNRIDELSKLRPDRSYDDLWDDAYRDYKDYLQSRRVPNVA